MPVGLHSDRIIAAWVPFSASEPGKQGCIPGQSPLLIRSAPGRLRSNLLFLRLQDLGAIQRKNKIQGCEYVFPYHGKRLGKINNSGWKSAWIKAGLPNHKDYTRGPHNLKHTFGRRLRNAGVPLETRKTLLHHTNGDITTHYSPAELKELIDAVEKIVQLKPGTFLRRKSTK